MITSIIAPDQGDHNFIQLTSNLAPSKTLDSGGNFSPVRLGGGEAR